MHRLFLFFFALIALTLTLGFDFYKHQMVAKSAGDSYGASEYFGGIKDRYSAFKSDQKTQTKDIADYVPQAPDGWTKREWVEADTELFFGTPLTPTAQEKESKANADEMMDSLAMKSAQAYATRGFKRVTQVYEKDGSAVLVSVHLMPARVESGFGGKQNAMMFDLLRLDEVEKDFARVGGVVFEENTEKDDTHSRRFSGLIGRQIDIDVRLVGQSADAIQIIAGLDFDGLNSMLKTPAEGVGNNQEVAFLATDLAGLSNGEGAAILAAAASTNAVKKAQEGTSSSSANKPKVRRFGQGNCTGKTFKRCVVKN